MQVGGILQSTYVGTRSHSSPKAESNSSSGPVVSSEGSSNVSFSKEALMKSLGSRFDVTNMTSMDMKAMATELKDNHLISEWEYADMTSVIKPITGSYDPNTTINFESQYAAQIEFSKQYSTPQDTRMLEKLHGLLVDIMAARG